MQTVRSASRAGSESRSASEAASTVSIPRLRQVRMIRTAISPRLAMRMRRMATVSLRAYAQQRLAVFDQRAVRREDLATTVPRTPARTAFISFITSMMPMMVSSSTREPTSTNGRRPGLGAR